MSDGDVALRATMDYSAVSQGYDAIISGASKAQSGISDHFKSGAGDFSSIGKNLGESLTSGMQASLGQFGMVGQALSGVATALGPIGLAAGVAGAALVGMAASGIQAAAAFETAMSGAKKVISLAPDVDSDAYFAKLGEDLQQISLRAPVAATDMAALAAVGGSLGVDSSQIAGFAEAAAQMSVAFELPAEEAATAAAKILNAFQQPISTENMQSLGNVINQIGDSMAATESDILDFTNRASFLNTTMGLSVSQVATLGGVLISAGLTAETASGGLKSAMNTLTSESSKTGGMDNWAKLMGVSVDELKTKVASDLPTTLIETANKIAAIEDPVTRFQTAVAMAGSEGAPALLKLAGAQDTYGSALEQTMSQWDKGQAGEKGGMAKTFEQNSSTFNAQMQILSNSMTYAGVAIGNVFLPIATQVASGLSSIVVAAVGAGKAIGGIVTGSAAFAALQSAISSVGGIISTVFGNFVSLVMPAWDALGGGTAAMSGLQTVFNAITAPITMVFTGIGEIAGALGSVASAMSPVASAIGEGLGGAITYASAFVQALTEIVSESETVRTISAIFDSIRAAISAVTEIAGKVFEGLTTAIPTAASGVATAIGSLFGQAGDAAVSGFSDVVKDSPLGPVLGFIGSVSDRANEIMGEGQKAGNALAEGIKKSDAQKAAVDLNNPENLKAAKEAGIDIGDAAGNEAGKEAAKKFANGFQEQAEISGLSSERLFEIINQQTGGSKGTGIRGEVSLDNNIKFALTDYNSLYLPDGSVIDFGSSSQLSGLKDTIYGYVENYINRNLTELEKAQLVGDFVTIARLSGKVQMEFDYSGILDPLKTRLENEGKIIGDQGSKTAQDAYTALLDNFREPAVEKLGDVLDEISTLAAERPLAASEYQLFGEEFKAKLYTSISDLKPYLKEQMEDLGKKGTDAFSDSFFSDAEKSDLMGMEPWLDYLKQKSPEEFAKAGGDSWLKFIDAIKKGASSGELEKMFSEMGQKAGKAYQDAMGNSWKDIKESFKLSDVLNSTDLKEWMSQVEDPIAFGANIFRPEWLDNVKWQLDQVKTGYAGTNEQAEAFVKTWDDFAQKYPFLFTTQQLDTFERFENGTINAKSALAEFSGQTEKASNEINYLKGKVDDFCTDTASEFQTWAEENKDVMFFGNGEGYVGPTSGYQTWKDQWMQERGLSESPTGEPIQIGMVAQIDTTQAEQDLEALRTGQGNRPITIAASSGTSQSYQIDLLRTTLNGTIKQVSTEIRNTSTLDRTMISATGTAISANIISAAISINATISQAAANIMEVLRDQSTSGAGGSRTSSSSGSSLSYANMDMPFYLMASGGYVDRPTFALIGEGGEGEYVVPESRMQSLLSSSVNVSVGFDVSNAARELESALSSLSIPAIPVPIAVTIDAAEIRAAIHQALADELDNLRLH